MPTRCLHGLDPSDCLICRTLAGDGAPSAAAGSRRGTRRAERREAAPGPGFAPSGLAPSAPQSPPAGQTAQTSGHHLGPVATLVVAAGLLLAVGAAVWLLVGVVFTILRVFELVAVAGGAGWAGYRIGHFRGSRHPRR